MGRITVLIVAREGRLRDGLRAVVKSLPMVESVMAADSTAETWLHVRKSAPDLVLLDANVPGKNLWKILADAEIKFPDVRWVVMVNNLTQLRQVSASGASGVLLKGFPTAALNRLIEQLFDPGSESKPAVKPLLV